MSRTAVLDDSCLAILNELNRKYSVSLYGIYEVVKPVRHDAVKRRVESMKEAGLIKEDSTEVYGYRDLMMAPFGVYVAEVLSGTGKNTLGVLKLAQESPDRAFTAAEISSKAGCTVKQAEMSIKSLLRKDRLKFVGNLTEGTELQAMYRYNHHYLS